MTQPTAGRPSPRRRHAAARGRRVVAAASVGAASVLGLGMAYAATTASAATAGTAPSSPTGGLVTAVPSSGSAATTPSTARAATPSTSSVPTYRYAPVTRSHAS